VVNADFSWNGISIARDWDVGVVASYLHYTQQFPVPLRLLPPGAKTSPTGLFPEGMQGAPNTWERQLRLSVVSTYSGFDDHNLRLGLGHDDLDLYRTQEFKNFTFVGSVPSPLPGVLAAIEVPVDESFLKPHRRRVDYMYAQDEWRFARDWTLTGGVRHDHYSDFGGTTNPRVAMVWDVSLDWTAKLLYGRAFRAPALTEQFSINNPVVRGNPDLKPETISTLEAAIAWQARTDVDVNLNVFQYQMKDIIRTVGGVWNNAGQQDGHGLELESYWNVSNGLWLAGQVNRIVGRKRTAGDTRPDIADYTTVDLSLHTSRDGGKGWEFSGSIRNLFNADVREPTADPRTVSYSIPNDLPMPRRSFYLQASYRM